MVEIAEMKQSSPDIRPVPFRGGAPAGAPYGPDPVRGTAGSCGNRNPQRLHIQPDIAAPFRGTRNFVQLWQTGLLWQHLLHRCGGLSSVQALASRSVLVSG